MNALLVQDWQNWDLDETFVGVVMPLTILSKQASKEDVGKAIQAQLNHLLGFHARLPKAIDAPPRHHPSNFLSTKESLPLLREWGFCNFRTGIILAT